MCVHGQRQCVRYAFVSFSTKKTYRRKNTTAGRGTDCNQREVCGSPLTRTPRACNKTKLGLLCGLLARGVAGGCTMHLSLNLPLRPSLLCTIENNGRYWISCVKQIVPPLVGSFHFGREREKKITKSTDTLRLDLFKCQWFSSFVIITTYSRRCSSLVRWKIWTCPIWILTAV